MKHKQKKNIKQLIINGPKPHDEQTVKKSKSYYYMHF